MVQRVAGFLREQNSGFCRPPQIGIGRHVRLTYLTPGHSATAAGWILTLPASFSLSSVSGRNQLSQFGWTSAQIREGSLSLPEGTGSAPRLHLLAKHQEKDETLLDWAIPPNSSPLATSTSEED